MDLLLVNRPFLVNLLELLFHFALLHLFIIFILNGFLGQRCHVKFIFLHLIIIVLVLVQHLLVEQVPHPLLVIPFFLFCLDFFQLRYLAIVNGDLVPVVFLSFFNQHLSGATSARVPPIAC